MAWLPMKKRATWLAASVCALSPMVVGGAASATHSGGFGTVLGTSSGYETRDTAVYNKTEGTCSNTNGVPFWAYTAKAKYRYPASGTTTVGEVRITGTDANHVARSYVGAINVFWEANQVWDGPRGTTQGFASNTAAVCNFGYTWPVTNATVTGVAPAGLSCSNPTVGTAGQTSGSYYRRFKLDDPSGLGKEQITLRFSSCTMGGGPFNNVVISLSDNAHGGCVDANVVKQGVGISDCASNYVVG